MLRPYKLHQVTILNTNRMTDGVYVSDSAARMNNSVIRFEVCFLANRLFE